MMLAGCAFLLVALLALPDQAAQAAREAIAVWGLDVAPSLFPYMVLCRTLTARLRTRRIPAHCVAAALGLMGGSPSGAAGVSACAQREGLTRRQILPLAALTGTLSPMFLLSTLRGWTGDARLCRLLLASHILGALFAFAVVRLYAGKGEKPRPMCDPSPGAQANPIAESVQAILSVGGCIVFFSVLAAVARLLIPALPDSAAAVLHAVLEVAGGARALAHASFDPQVRAVLLATACGFTGLSILSQNLLFFRPLGVRLSHLLAIGLLRAVGAGAAMACLMLVVP